MANPSETPNEWHLRVRRESNNYWVISYNFDILQAHTDVDSQSPTVGRLARVLRRYLWARGQISSGRNNAGTIER